MFLVDIPASITLAQVLSPLQRQFTVPAHKYEERPNKIIISSPAPTTPFTLPEPKSDGARERVLQRIPDSGTWAAPIGEFCLKSLEVIHRSGLSTQSSRLNNIGPAEWCRPRKCKVDNVREGLLQLQHEDYHPHTTTSAAATSEPPIILSPNGPNMFGCMSEIRHVVVKNPAPLGTTLAIPAPIISSGSPASQARGDGSIGGGPADCETFNIPPRAKFILCNLPLQQLGGPGPKQPRGKGMSPVIPSLPRAKEFNVIILDPPWPNRSARRSQSYHTKSYVDMDTLTDYIRQVLCTHLRLRNGRAPTRTTGEDDGDDDIPSLGAIWTTNSEKVRRAAYRALESAGLHVFEEWVLIKTTGHGELITPIDALWRKPYEILIIGINSCKVHGRGQQQITRRAIVAVPDVHSRKPNLREVFERVFLGRCRDGYSALEVFARNLTAGWWACGDEVVKFNSDEWWT